MMVDSGVSQPSRSAERGHLDRAATIGQDGASVTGREEPIDGLDVERIVGTVDGSARMEWTLDGKPDDVNGAADSNANAANIDRRTFRDAEPNGDGLGQCDMVGPRRLDVVSVHQLAGNAVEPSVMAVQLDRRSRCIGRHDRLGVPIIAARQQPDQLQDPFQLVGFDAQQLRRRDAGPFLRFDQIGSSGDRGHTVTERVCQPAEQFVVYGKPARRAIAAARG